MKWSSRFIGLLVVTACLAVTFVFVSKETFSWFQTINTPAPSSVTEVDREEDDKRQTGGIDMGDTSIDTEFRGELHEKEDMHKLTIGRGNGDSPGGLGTLFVLLAAVGLIVYGFRKWIHRRKGNRFAFPFMYDASVQPSLEADASIETQAFPKLTNIELRDSLITFNASLPLPLKLRPNETLVDWFARIELTDIDASLYHLIRYGPESTRDISIEYQQQFRQALNHYLKQQS